ncbi:MAG: TolC family protein [Alloprevotella sp.]
MKKFSLTFFFLLLAGNGTAQSQPLSLDSCRTLAIRHNKDLRMADLNQQIAACERKVSTTKFLPRVSAVGAYLHTSREFSLLSDGQKAGLSHAGSVLGSSLALPESMVGALDEFGQSLVEALHTDTRNMGTATVTLTQPLYMGGKIAAYHQITGLAQQIAEQKRDATLQGVIVEVDEAYWRIVLLNSKKKLAEGYLELVQTLDNDIQQMIAEGVATKADGLSVKVKVNEAKVSCIQIDNGLSLARMMLCQVCGLPLDAEVGVTDEESDTLPLLVTDVETDVQAAFALRPELQALRLSADIWKEKIRLTRAESLPTVALTGGWAGTNPSVFNSFERRFKGMWNVGVVVNIPLLTSGERIHKVRAAKVKESIARLELEETREKVELQVNRNRLKMSEATERLNTAVRSCEEADENLRHANLGLQEGVIPVSNVLEAQTAWLSARSELVSSRIDLRLADLYLKQSLGTLNDSFARP